MSPCVQFTGEKWEKNEVVLLVCLFVFSAFHPTSFPAVQPHTRKLYLCLSLWNNSHVSINNKMVL